MSAIRGGTGQCRLHQVHDPFETMENPQAGMSWSANRPIIPS
jgi:hypothetical protein